MKRLDSILPGGVCDWSNFLQAIAGSRCGEGTLKECVLIEILKARVSCRSNHFDRYSQNGLGLLGNTKFPSRDSDEARCNSIGLQLVWFACRRANAGVFAMQETSQSASASRYRALAVVLAA